MITATAVNPYDNLAEEERIQRIGELLAKAAVFYLRSIDKADRGAPSKPAAIRRLEVWETVDDELEKQILRYLHRSVQASPVQIGRALTIPKTTLFRRLAQLRQAGLIRSQGATTNKRYEITDGGKSYC